MAIPVVGLRHLGKVAIKGQQQHQQNGNDSTMQFYGGSFITDGRGEIIQEASKDKEQILSTTFDLDQLAIERQQWGVFRDRRPSMYGTLLNHG